jgi:hypothetical protein
MLLLVIGRCKKIGLYQCYKIHMYFRESWSVGVHNLCSEVKWGRAYGHIDGHFDNRGVQNGFPYFRPLKICNHLLSVS